LPQAIGCPLASLRRPYWSPERGGVERGLAGTHTQNTAHCAFLIGAAAVPCLLVDLSRSKIKSSMAIDTLACIELSRLMIFYLRLLFANIC